MKLGMSDVRRWSRTLHRDLSYLFSGVLLVYVVSGFMLNHKDDFNSDYRIGQHCYTIADIPSEVDDAFAASLLECWGMQDKFVAVYDYDEESLKVFVRGGSSLLVNRNTGEAMFESVERRPVWSALNRLHYNPDRRWTIFSDIFLASMLVIVITGLIMVKGRNGVTGRGGIELVIGIAVPLLFMLL